MYSERFYYKYIIGFWTQKRINIVKTYTVVALRGDASNSTFCCV